MQGEKRTCKSCGHRCHCYRPDCEECVNDVCTVCQCQDELIRQQQDPKHNQSAFKGLR